MSSRGKETRYWCFKTSNFVPELWNVNKDIEYLVFNKASQQGAVIFHSRKRPSAVSKAIPNADHYEALDHSNLDQTIRKHRSGGFFQRGRYRNPTEEFKSSIESLLVSGALSLGEFLRCSPFYQTYPEFAEELIIKKTTFTADDFDGIEDETGVRI